MWLLSLAACQPHGTATIVDDVPPDDTGTPPDPPDPHSAVVVTHTGGHSAAPTGDTGADHTAVPVDPCTMVPQQILGVRRVSNVPPTEEFAFDTVGNVANADEGNGVFLTDFAGNRTLVSPADSWEYAGARITPDGSSLAVCDEAGGQVTLVNLTTGAQTNVLSTPAPNSLGWDDWGRLWVTSVGRLLHFDPAVGGAPDVVVDFSGSDLDGITFAPDGHTVYFNDDTTSIVYYIDLDAYGEPTGGGVLADLSQGYWIAYELDGMTTDICGNLYVVQTDGQLWRLWTDGTIQVLAPGTGTWTTSVNFGSGIGGWARDRLYVMDRSSGLFEVNVGIEGHPEPHLP